MKETQLKHRGLFGSVEVSFDDNCLHGEILHISDTVLYEGETPNQLKQAFIEAVDDYITTLLRVNR